MENNEFVQVGVCSGLVLGVLAAMLAMHFCLNRRSAGVALASKLSTDPTGGFSSSYYSPGRFYSIYYHPILLPVSRGDAERQ